MAFSMLVFLLMFVLVRSEPFFDNMEVGSEVLRSLYANGLAPEDISKAISQYISQEALPKESKNDLCRNHSQQLLDSLQTASWPLLMLDSYGKLEAGVMAGNIKWLGNYDECLSIKVPANVTEGFDGKYCLAKVHLEMDSGSQTKSSVSPTRHFGFLGEDIALRAGGNQDFLKEGGMSPIMFSMFLEVMGGIQFGICVPSSCTADDLQPLFIPTEKINITITVDPNACSDVSRDFEAKDWGMLALLIIFGTAIVLSTGYDLWNNWSGKQHRSGRWQNLLVAFSFYSNGKRLLSTTSSSDTMGCIHGIRFFSMAWVLLCHKFMTMATTPILNQQYMMDHVGDWQKMAIVNGWLSVDTFFLLSGILLVYMFLKEVEKTNRFNVKDLLVFYIHRYIRLTPVLAIIVGINATLFYFIGSGPIWESVVAPMRENCARSWWKTLIYVDNYKYISEFSGGECVSQSWYLQTDMQLYWLSPLFLYPLWRKPVAGLAVLVILTIVCIVVPFWLTMDLELSWTVVLNGLKYRDYMTYIYPTVYCRGGVYFIGAMFGYYLYKTRNQRIHIPKWQVLLGWIFSTTVCLTVLYSLVIVYQDGYKENEVEAAFYSSLHRNAWAVGLGWVIFACVKGYGGPVNTILSWKVLQPLSRLTYCAYLTHLLILQYLAGCTKTSDFYSDSRIAESFLGDLVLTLMLSTIFSLSFESPILIIEKEIFRKGGSRKNQQPDTTKILGTHKDCSSNSNEHTNVTFIEDNGKISPEVVVHNNTSKELRY